jgi:hypothetical protein
MFHFELNVLASAAGSRSKATAWASRSDRSHALKTLEPGRNIKAPFS